MKYKKSKSIIFAICIISIILGNFVNEKDTYLNLNHSDDSINHSIGVSNSWDLGYSIIIDNNWSNTRDAYDWCSGLGTSVSPYIIENITINGQGKDFCIIIRNTNEYFIIRNSTFSNVEDTPGGSALELSNVTNGIVVTNEISNNGNIGMTVKPCENITISHNQFKNNEYYAIYIEASNSSISNNYFEDNYYFAIRGGGQHMIIRDNFFEANGLACGGDYLFIFNNTIKGGGLSITSDNSRVVNNVMTGKTDLHT